MIFTGRVLIVDDDASLRKTLADILSSRGYNATPVSSGENAS